MAFFFFSFNGFKFSAKNYGKNQATNKKDAMN